MMPFSETLLCWRLARGFTQIELARASGVSRPNLSAMERGDREVTLRTLRALAAALNVRPGVLADGEGPLALGPPLRREDLERIAGSAAEGRTLTDRREAALADNLRATMSSRLGGASASGLRSPSGKRQLGRRSDRAYLLLRSAQSSEVIASLIARTAGHAARSKPERDER